MRKTEGQCEIPHLFCHCNPFNSGLHFKLIVLGGARDGGHLPAFSRSSLRHRNSSASILREPHTRPRAGCAARGGRDAAGKSVKFTLKKSWSSATRCESRTPRVGSTAAVVPARLASPSTRNFFACSQPTAAPRVGSIRLLALAAFACRRRARRLLVLIALMSFFLPQPDGR